MGCIQNGQKIGQHPRWKVLHLRRSGRETEENARQGIVKSIYEYNLARVENREPVIQVYLDGTPKDYDLYRFASWAFGDGGLPNLEILAFGDFSYNNRYSDRNILLVPMEGRRGGQGQGRFKTVKYDSIDQWTSASKVTDFLGACPTEKLLQDSSHSIFI